MKKPVSSLKLNKKTIAKLNDEQLKAVKGGKGASKTVIVDDPTSSYTCNTSTCS
jgi:natural product precursor